MVNQELISLIKFEKSAGKSPPEVEEILISKGFNKEEVDEAINYVINPNSNQESSSKYSENEQQSPSITSTINPQPDSNNSSNQTSSQYSMSLNSSIKIKRRNPLLVVLYTLISFGIYGIVWYVKTSQELYKNTTTAIKPIKLLFLLIPIFGVVYSFFYLWRYCRAVNELTKFNNVVLYLIFLFTGIGGIIATQIQLNKKAN